MCSHLPSPCKVCQQEEDPDDSAILGIDHVYHASGKGQDSLWLVSHEEERSDLYLNND